MNSPSSASPSWPASATSTSTLGSNTPAQTESGDADLITIKDNNDGQVYNIQNRRNPDKRIFDMEFKPANDGVQVKSFAWYLSTPTGTEPENRKKIESAEANAQDGILFQRSEPGNKTFVCLNVTDADKHYHDDLNKVMVIGIYWAFGKQEGETLSSAFSITPNDGEQVHENVWWNIQKSYYNVSRVEIFSSGGSDGHNGFTPPNNSSGDNKNDSNSNSTGISDMPALGGNSSSSHSRGRGGLSTGAIAGIAVGVAIAALLAAALGIFLILRRRRERGGGTPSSSALHHTHAAEQEKLSSFPKGGGIAGGASASDAAIAPYRDDNSTLTNSHDRRRSSAAAGAVVAQGEDAARDRQPSPPNMATESRHSRTGNGVSRHLVEDGMTAEEIRRLEEEEAQLDVEIQRANGGRR